MTHLPTASAGLLTPQHLEHRGPIRRALDWAVASRAHRVVCLLTGLWLINLFDLALTLLAHEQGLLEEANPVARRLLPLGPQALVVFKLILVGGSSAVLIRYRARLLSELTAALMLLLYTGVAVRWRLCYELYVFTHSTDPSVADLERLEAWASSFPIL